ncbi:MAG: hypothetical protein ACNS62_19115 [Candidatus Cyclobacteriaceae bacterium M3_2C_046]
MKLFTHILFLSGFLYILTAGTEPAKECSMHLQQVERKSFDVNAGDKIMVTYAIENWKDQEACWQALEKAGAKELQDHSFGAVYFFNLAPDDIPQLTQSETNFEQYGADVIAEYWKDPSNQAYLERTPFTEKPY